MNKLVKVTMFVSLFLCVSVYTKTSAMDTAEITLIQQMQNFGVSKTINQVAFEIKAFVENVLIENYCHLSINNANRLQPEAFQVSIKNNGGFALLFLGSRPIVLLTPIGNLMIGDTFSFNTSYSPQKASILFCLLNEKFGLVPIGHFFLKNFDCSCKIFSLSKNCDGIFLPRAEI